MRGNQFHSDVEGAHSSGEPLLGSLSRPSPSANLVGIWKGEPPGPHVAAPVFTPFKQILVVL
jgi:hypothetical protein